MLGVFFLFFLPSANGVWSDEDQLAFSNRFCVINFVNKKKSIIPDKQTLELIEQDFAGLALLCNYLFLVAFEGRNAQR
jgi:hypothetical protein